MNMTRREALLGAVSARALMARRTMDRSRISAITDEIGNTAPEAIQFAKQYGLQFVEVRSLREKKKEYAFLSEPELKAEAAAFRNAGLKVSFLNTGLLKFTWPGTEAARQRQETDEARARRRESEAKRFENRTEDLRKALNAAHILGVGKIRVFTGMRVEDPRALMPRIADVLGAMAFVAEKEKAQLLVENEGSCNVSTSAELAELMRLLPSKAIGINWDPQNVLAHNEQPYPDGYNLLPKKRIANVQIKGKGVMPESDQKLDWKAIMAGMNQDGYRGKFGLETHIFDGTLIPSAHISMKEILRIVDEV
jgi:sugar phosphate isomerase/epimerase